MSHIRTDHLGLPRAESLVSLYHESADDTWFAELISHQLMDPATDMSRRPSKKIRAHLVSLGYQCIHGQEFRSPAEAYQIERARQAIELLHAGSLMVDDLQDASSSRRGAPASHLTYGVGRTINSANWLYFWPLRLLTDAGLNPDQREQIQEVYMLALERSHTGQALDLGIDMTTTPRDKWTTVINATTRFKTGSITELAMTIGAIIAEAPAATRQQVAAIGLEFGMILQRLDDLGNLFTAQNGDKVCEDLLAKKPTWVWALALDLDLADELCKLVDSPERLTTWSKRAAIRDHGLQIVVRQKAAIRAMCDELPEFGKELYVSMETLEEELFHAYLKS